MTDENAPTTDTSRLGVLAAASLSLMLLTGCPSFTSFRSARALQPGQLQMTGAAEVLGMTAPSNSGLGGARPSIGFAARYGVADGVDLGLKMGPIAGVAVDGTFQLARGPVDVALGPGFSYFSTPVPVGYGPKTVEQLATSPDYTIVAPSVPVLVGVNLGRGHQLIFAPRATAWFVQPQASQPGGGAVTGGMEILGGLSAGVSIKTFGRLRVMPEVGATVPIAWTGASPDTCTGAACAPIHAHAVVVQGGIAIIIGPDDLGP